MSLNIDTLVNDMCEAKGYPQIISDIMTNTCYLGGPPILSDGGYSPGYLDSKDKVIVPASSKSIRSNLTNVTEVFFFGSFYNVLLNIKFLLEFLVVTRNVAKPEYSDSGAKERIDHYPWDDREIMRNLVGYYETVMKITDYDVWDGTDLDLSTIFAALIRDVSKLMDNEEDEAITTGRKDEFNEPFHTSDPALCKRIYSSLFFRLLARMIRGVLVPGYFRKQTEVLSRVYADIYEGRKNPSIMYHIQSFESVDIRMRNPGTFKKYTDQEFEEMTALYNRLPQDEFRADINKTLVYSGVQTQLLTDLIPEDNFGSYNYEQILGEMYVNFERRMYETNLFEHKTHDEVIIPTRINDYLLNIMSRQLEFPDTRGFGEFSLGTYTYIRQRQKQQATQREENERLKKDALQKAMYARRDEEALLRQERLAKAKALLGEARGLGVPKVVTTEVVTTTGSWNTTMIIILVLIAVGIVIYFV